MMLFNPLFLQVVNPAASTEIKAAKIYNPTYLFSDIIKVYSDKTQLQDAKVTTEGSSLLDFLKQLLPGSINPQTSGFFTGLNSGEIPPVKVSKAQLDAFISNLLSGKTPDETNLTIGSAEGKLIILNDNGEAKAPLDEKSENNPKAILDYLQSGNFLLLNTPGQNVQQGLVVSINTDINETENTVLSGNGNTDGPKVYTLNFSLLDKSVTKSIESVLSGQYNPEIQLVNSADVTKYSGVDNTANNIPHEINTGAGPVKLTDAAALSEIISGKEPGAGTKEKMVINKAVNTPIINTQAESGNSTTAANLINKPGPTVDNNGKIQNIFSGTEAPSVKVGTGNQVVTTDLSLTEPGHSSNQISETVLPESNKGNTLSQSAKTKVPAGTQSTFLKSEAKVTDSNNSVSSQNPEAIKTGKSLDSSIEQIQPGYENKIAAKKPVSVPDENNTRVFSFSKQKAFVSEVTDSGKIKVSSLNNNKTQVSTGKIKNLFKAEFPASKNIPDAVSNTEESPQTPFKKITGLVKDLSEKGIAVEYSVNSNAKTTLRKNIKQIITESDSSAGTMKENSDGLLENLPKKNVKENVAPELKQPFAEFNKNKIKANVTEVTGNIEKESTPKETIKANVQQTVDEGMKTGTTVKPKLNTPEESGSQASLKEEIKFTKIIANLASEKLNVLAQVETESSKTPEIIKVNSSGPADEKPPVIADSLKQNKVSKEEFNPGQNTEDETSKQEKSEQNKNPEIRAGKESVNFSDFQNTHKLEQVNQSQNLRVVKAIEIIKELSKFIKQKSNDTLVLRLEPENLGMIKIAVESTDKILKAHIEVENEAARKMIEGNLSNLFSSLNQNGVQLNTVNISLMNNEPRGAKNFMPRKKSGNEFKEFTEENNNGPVEKNLGYNTYEYLV